MLSTLGNELMRSCVMSAGAQPGNPHLKNVGSELVGVSSRYIAWT